MTRKEAHKMIKCGLKVCHCNLNHDYLFMDKDFIIRNDKLTLATVQYTVSKYSK